MQKLHIVNSMPFLFLMFSFCFNFHQLWLLYDIFLVCSFFYFMNSKNSRNKVFLVCSLLVALIYSMISAFEKFNILVLISWWDTYKHLILIYFAGDYSRYVKRKEALAHFYFIIKVVLYTFALQVAMVCYQAFQGLEFDDISGFLGDGSTHSLGVMSLVAVVIVRHFGFSIFKQLLAISAFFLVNYLGENIGAIFLLFVLILLSFLSTPKKILGGVLFFLLMVGLLFVYGNSYLDFFMSRLNSMFDLEAMGYLDRANRGTLLIYAIELGGVFGYGPGQFSQIYGLTGDGVSFLVNRQINISEATHIISEYGVFGLLLLFVIYGISILHFFGHRLLFFYAFFIFCLVAFYNRLLMDERIIFFLVLLAFLVRLFEFLKKTVVKL